MVSMRAFENINDYQEELRSVDVRITQHLKVLETLRDESAFLTAKLTHELTEKDRILKSLYGGN